MSGIIRPFFSAPAKHAYRLMSDAQYRHYVRLTSKLKRTPRFTVRTVTVGQWTLTVPDAASFLSAYREIFVERIYAFRSGKDAPRILDLGANIGLSVLFFKQLFPKSRVMALEADPQIFEHLKKNVFGNGYTDVQLLNKAAWIENTTLSFSSEGGDGGRAALPGDANLIEVGALDIRDVLRNNKFDFLKMDIEGAEESVLPACKDHLAGIQYVFVEYHSPAGKKQCLDAIIGTLADAGFRMHIHSPLYSPSPFIEVRLNSGFDLQLNIFAWKDHNDLL